MWKSEGYTHTIYTHTRSLVVSLTSEVWLNSRPRWSSKWVQADQMWLSNPTDLTSGCLASSLTATQLLSILLRKPADTVASH